ncbi:oligoendopeptidase F [Mesomycoplasma lagogenitalium]|uniref:Oligopeptidase F n=1 Tax=Mesomycoplasma lagogenitalium TaxID=171286 RepID=A0ABY8LSU4_9BACT|nr:oligoendopeptidase F [Mesomycoplasma lagogenitalium]WGI36329.1 oligoendopeptidase F [Mesomycoplasma lagogenitalium]
MKKYNKYNEIPEKYKFDLEDILKNKSIEKMIEELDFYTERLISNKDKQYENIENFLEYKKYYKEYKIFFYKIYNYISNKKNTNIVDPYINNLSGILTNKNAEFIKNLGSEENRFFQNIEKINVWKEDPRLKIYKKDIELSIENKQYKLDDKVENYLSQISKGEISLYETFSILKDSETKFKNVFVSKTKSQELNLGNYRQFLKNKNEDIRKQAYNNFLDAYLERKQTFASLLEQHLKNLSSLALSRGFNSLVEKEIYKDRVNKNLLKTVFEAVQKHKNLYDKYEKIQKKFFKLKYNKKMQKWDSSLPLVSVKQNYSVEEAQELLYKAVEPLGNEYLEKVKSAIEQRWVDYLPVQSKRSGAYSIGGHYEIDKKYILMNFDGTLDSVSTLAHEMGHSMHSWYSDKSQPFELADYPIFLAEIASIFNELMLFDYLFKNSKSDKFKFYLLEQSIKDFLGTVVRQCKWANYEYKLYEKIDLGQSVKGFEALEKIYVNVMNKYTDNEKEKIGNKSNIYAVIVPHYYYNFYVYKYAIGYIVANVFFQKYKEEGQKALELYINEFLSSGSKDLPLKILKDAQIDLYDQKIYEKAFKILSDKINLYKKLGERIFKNKRGE